MSKKTTSVAAETLKLFERLVATLPSVERKGAATPYTSLNGHMFSFLTREGKLALRLPDDQREAFLKKYRTTLCEQHGRVMKEYVVVPNALLRKTSELKRFFVRSHAYVGTLKPKPTTRTKKGATTGTRKARKKVVKKTARPKRRP